MIVHHRLQLPQRLLKLTQMVAPDKAKAKAHTATLLVLHRPTWWAWASTSARELSSTSTLRSEQLRKASLLRVSSLVTRERLYCAFVAPCLLPAGYRSCARADRCES